MRLVIEYVVTDNYTYWATETNPVEYESAEAFAVDFEAMVRESHQSRRGEFYLADTQWPSHECMKFIDGEWKYTAPDIMTVDEWFARTNG